MTLTGFCKKDSEDEGLGLIHLSTPNERIFHPPKVTGWRMDPTCSTTHGCAEGNRQTKGEDRRNDAFKMGEVVTETSSPTQFTWNLYEFIVIVSHIKSSEFDVESFLIKNINI